MRRQLMTATLVTVVLTVLLGVVYPLSVTGISQLAFRDKANGSIIERSGVAVGSSLIGQNFTGAQYFHPRPSAAGSDGYDGAASSGSNLGPSNPDLLIAVEERIADYRSENNLTPDALVPVDAVTASGSGLDPHISVANARLQASRVAAERRLPVDDVLQVIRKATNERALGVLGEPGVNVLEINLRLDQMTE